MTCSRRTNSARVRREVLEVDADHPESSRVVARELLGARAAPPRTVGTTTRRTRSPPDGRAAPRASRSRRSCVFSVKSGAGVPTRALLASVGDTAVVGVRRRGAGTLMVALVREDQREHAGRNRQRQRARARRSRHATAAGAVVGRRASGRGRRRQRRRTPASGRRSTRRRTGSRLAASGSRMSANARATNTTPSTSTATA